MREAISKEEAAERIHGIVNELTGVQRIMIELGAGADIRNYLSDLELIAVALEQD
jgi:hypothetical protein